MTDPQLETLFRAWWAESFPNSPPGTHALATHLGFARHLLNQLGEQQHPEQPR